MPTDTKLNQLIINQLTQEQYDEAKAAGTLSDTELYITDSDDDAQVKSNLSQTIDDSTTKYPSNKAVKDESSRIVSIMDTGLAKKVNVNATTIGEITDLRTPRLNKGNTSTVYIDGYMINSEDDINGCLVAPELNTNGTICFRLLARKKVNGVNMYRGLKVGVKTDGSTYTELDYSQNNNSIVTTVSHGSNYVRFGNGIQICFGTLVTQNNTLSVTYSAPFNTENPYLTVSLIDGGPADSKYWQASKIANISGTGFKIQGPAEASRFGWIAIGYWY